MDVAVARDDPCDDPAIQGYEPNKFGYTKQNDDVWFLDFTVSIKAQLFRGICRHFQGKDQLYLTFTGRFGFYVATRPSGPVVAKNYNPKLLWRVIPDTQSTTTSTGVDRKLVQEYTEYFDFAYAHDSNGQSIDSQEEYDIQASQLGNATYARDYISRGWDYLQFAFKDTYAGLISKSTRISIYPDFKFFLRHGLLQGVPEEYHSWEQGSTLYPRHAFDGLSATVECLPFATEISHDPMNTPWKATIRVAFKYLTGYDPVARYNTFRGEFGFSAFGVPLNLWIQDGYMNSLARYFTKTTSAGIELRFAQF